MAIYVGINGVPKKASAMYVGVNGTPKKVKTVYGSENGTLKKVLRTATVTYTEKSGSKVFTSSGSFTVPSGCTSISVFAVGGGGKGDASGVTGVWWGSSWSKDSGGGGGGGFNIQKSVSVSPGSSISVTIGAARGNTSIGSNTASAGGNAAGYAGGASNSGRGGNGMHFWIDTMPESLCSWPSSSGSNGVSYNGTYYGGGGGAGWGVGGIWGNWTDGSWSGGLGGGGNGGSIDGYLPTAGSANTGGGGGGARCLVTPDQSPADGGSGIAIIQWTAKVENITWS